MTSFTQTTLLWETLQVARWRLAELKDALSMMEQCDVERFIVLFRWASWKVRYPWDGVIVPGVGCLSEDSTEDLCDWIVSQGRDVWMYACAKDSHPAHLYPFQYKSTSYKDLQLRTWNLDMDEQYRGYQSPFYLGVRLLQLEFDVDYWEHSDELHDLHEPTPP